MVSSSVWFIVNERLRLIYYFKLKSKQTNRYKWRSIIYVSVIYDNDNFHTFAAPVCPISRFTSTFRPPYENSIWKSKSQSAFLNEKNQCKSNAVQRSLTHSNMAIAELQAKLQQSGESEWRKRHLRINNTNEELKNIYNVRVCSYVSTVS